MYLHYTQLLTALSLVITALSQDPSSGPPFPEPPRLASTTTWNESIIFTCPPAPTILVNVTQYVPITDITTDTDTTTTSIWNTTTIPITIYQTIISTTILTSVSYRVLIDAPSSLPESQNSTSLQSTDFTRRISLLKLQQP